MGEHGEATAASAAVSASPRSPLSSRDLLHAVPAAGKEAEPARRPAVTPPRAGSPSGDRPAIPPDAHRRRRALLIAISVLIVVGALVRIALTATHVGPVLGGVGVTNIPTSQLTLGTCLAAETVGSDVRTVGAITCAQPHTSEVFAVRHLAAGPYPGDADIKAGAEAACTGPDFTAFAQQPAEDTSLKIQFLIPTAASWAQGQTSISCLVSASSGLTIGTLRKTAK